MPEGSSSEVSLASLVPFTLHSAVAADCCSTHFLILPVSISVSLKDILLRGVVLAEKVLVGVTTREGPGIVLPEEVLVVVLT